MSKIDVPKRYELRERLVTKRQPVTRSAWPSSRVTLLVRALQPGSDLERIQEEWPMPLPNAGKVLIVDDSEPSLYGLGQLLQHAQYSVLTTTNGADAFEIVKRERPDLVLLDVVMPGISGLDICAELKRNADTRLTPVVLISGDQERETRLAGLESGADDFLKKPVDTQELRARLRSLMRLKRLTDDLETAESLFLALGRIIEARDPCTEGHCERLAEYATALGKRLNVDRPGLDALCRGAFLHDVGKIAIPDRVLLKKGRLTRKEYELMKRHPAIGDDLCSTVRSFESVRPIVRHHHERLDGCGYPDGLAGDEVPLLAQIVSIVDVFDALTTNRPYRKALATSTAYGMMRTDARGGWCREELVETFIDLHSASEIERANTAVWAYACPKPLPSASPVASRKLRIRQRSESVAVAVRTTVAVPRERPARPS